MCALGTSAAPVFAAPLHRGPRSRYEISFEPNTPGQGSEFGKMMVPDPLRSATDVEGAEDTSLAMPSDKSLSSGQQRVLSQVSMKRSKSKYNKNTSPTSMETAFLEFI